MRLKLKVVRRIYISDKTYNKQYILSQCIPSPRSLGHYEGYISVGPPPNLNNEPLNQLRYIAQITRLLSDIARVPTTHILYNMLI